MEQVTSRRRGITSTSPKHRRGTVTPHKRQATLFDAVAGRVSINGFITPDPIPLKKHRDTVSSSTVPIKPDELLFKRQNAPTRFAETDQYFTNRHLNHYQKLPRPELLVSLHAYASEFYGCAIQRGSKKAWRSMDETALLAMGILVEEAVRESLGETGDLTFTEEEDRDHLSNAEVWNGVKWVRSVLAREHAIPETELRRQSPRVNKSVPPHSKRRRTESISNSQRDQS